MTQAQLAARLGLKSPSTIALWEKELRRPPRSILPRLATELGCTIDELVNRCDREPPERPSVRKEVKHMNAKFEIDPTLLDDAVELMRDEWARCRADACALASLVTPEARELAQERLEMAKKADKLVDVFAGQ